MATFNLGKGHDVTKSDTANDDFGWVLCTTSGTIIIVNEDESEHTLAAPPVNVWIPVGKARAIKVASTALGMMVV